MQVVLLTGIKRTKVFTMEGRKRNRIIVILLILIAISFGAYLYLTQSKESIKVVKEYPDSTALKLAVLPTIECLPFYVASEYGIADSLGLKLKLFTFDSAMDADTAFINHRVDGVASEMMKLSIYQSRGDSVTAIMGGECSLSLISSKQSRITTIKDLKDKIVATTRHSIVDYFIDKIIALGSKDSLTINTPQINSFHVRKDMILQNQVDGGILPEPYSSICISKGCKQISKLSEIKDCSGMFALIINDSVKSCRESDIKKLIEVYNISVDFINNHMSKEKHNFLSLLSFPDGISDSIFVFPHFNHAVSPSTKSFTECSQWAQNKGFIKRIMKSDILTSEFIPQDSISHLSTYSK